MADINIREIVGSKCEGINAHMFSVDALCKGFDTNVDTGLTEEQAKENLKKYGPNRKERMPECTMVKRDNEFKSIMTEDLVPGDIVLLQADSGNFGDICGDIRILKIMEPVHVESYSLYKDCLNYIKEMTTEQTSEDPLETNNLIFHGTSLFVGKCIGMVFQTGDNMLLSDVSYDLLATPALYDSDDESKGGFLARVVHGISNMFKSKKEDEKGEMELTFHQDTIEKICEEFNTDVNKGLTSEQVAINQEKSGKNKNHSKYDKIQDYTLCKRDGEFQNILSKRLTFGDIVSLKAPQIVPADIRIVEASPDCKVDKSVLTGESEPQKVSTEKTHGNPLETENIVFATTKITTGSCTGIVVKVGKGTVMGGLSGLSSELT